MENTVNARFECTYTLAHILSLGHKCMLMMSDIKNSGLFTFLVCCVTRGVRPIIACAVQSTYTKADAPKNC